jgi:CHAT domain-containing protein
MNRSNIGVVYRDMKKYSKALEFYAEALKNLQTTHGQRHLEIADNYLKIADVYYEMGKLDQALLNYQLALISNTPDFTNTDPYSQPTSNDCFSNNTFLESLKQKALTFVERFSKPSEGIDDAEAALKHFLRASDFVDHVRQNYKAEGSKLLLGQSANQFYNVAITTTLELCRQVKENRYKKAVFHFFEKSKTGILLEALSESQAKHFAGIPDSLLEKERQLRIDLAFYDKSLTEEKLKGENGDSAKIVLWQDKVFNLKQQYVSLLERLEKEFPDYYNLKYQTNTASVQQVQEQILDENTALVEYFTGEDSIFVFTITKNDFDVNATARDSLFERRIEQLRDGIIKKDYAQYIKAAHLLYQTLLEPIKNKLNARNLIIVPDGAINAVPFEALLAQAVDAENKEYSRLPYLANDHAISFAYSATLLLETLKRHRTQNKRDYLAYAPVFPAGLPVDSRGADFVNRNLAVDSVRTAGRVFGYLSASKQEVTGVMEQFKSRHGFFDRWFGNKAKVYLEREAKEENLKSTTLRDYRYVHFATHGLLNEKSPKLSGLVLAQDTTSSEDGILYLGEIYNLDLNADLLTLSACETGLGQIAKGEGIIGLTRGFLYAGAANLLVSLWQVNDQTTADLMVDFYGNMLNGQIKAEALRQAKLKLIQSHPEYAKPYYWAPFILIGK